MPRRWLFLAPLCAAMVMPGCGGGSSSPDESAPAMQARADMLVEYTVRGRVTQLPGGPEHPAREFMVRHEEIPEFLYSMATDETRMGMKSMTMAFPLGEGVSLEGVEVGTPIEMMFETTYEGESGRLRGYTVRRITLLDPSTPLQIEEQAPRLP